MRSVGRGGLRGTDSSQAPHPRDWGRSRRVPCRFCGSHLLQRSAQHLSGTDQGSPRERGVAPPAGSLMPQGRMFHRDDTSSATGLMLRLRWSGTHIPIPWVPRPKVPLASCSRPIPLGMPILRMRRGGGGDDYLPSFGRSIRLPTFGGRNHALAHRADRLRHHPRATPRELPLAPHGMAPPAAFTRHGQSATMGWPKLVPTDPNSQA